MTFEGKGARVKGKEKRVFRSFKRGNCVGEGKGDGRESCKGETPREGERQEHLLLNQKTGPTYYSEREEKSEESQRPRGRKIAPGEGGKGSGIKNINKER